MKKPTAKAYRFRLHGHPWMTYVGPVRNKIEAEQALSKQFGPLLREVRLHPFCDPFHSQEKSTSLRRGDQAMNMKNRRQ
jgi:hypothetical protein